MSARTKITALKYRKKKQKPNTQDILRITPGFSVYTNFPKYRKSDEKPRPVAETREFTKRVYHHPVEVASPTLMKNTISKMSIIQTPRSASVAHHPFEPTAP